ncbi:hypothetical protein BT96DRAFT_1024492 [Gymnopus androsaceus JB14]|uniref:Uncharacterized protein n=1 Tax=Gymnopus androsaceus JB14 TaxID=1447944 RepID=A0A6A4GYP7_9AGAR|nr:hypothetical protein BT96DRAFT_1024492 [Gymnopus androsaceus JB14]
MRFWAQIQIPRILNTFEDLGSLSKLRDVSVIHLRSQYITLRNSLLDLQPILDELPSIVLATGDGAVYTNDTVNAVAFLNTGGCGPNGGLCTAVDLELGLVNGSSTAIIDLVPTHEFTVPVSFVFYNGCDGSGTSCSSADCTTAEGSTTPGQGLIQCADDGASVKVTFCPGNATSTSSSASSTSTSASSSSSSASSSFAATASSTTGSDLSGSSTKTSIVGPVVGGVVGGVAAIALLVFLLTPQGLTYSPYAPETLDSTTAVPYMVQRPTFNSSPSKSSSVGYGAGLASTSSDGLGMGMVPGPAPSTITRTQSPAQTNSAPSSIPPSESPTTQANNLDLIIDGLARRFGWTQPPSDQDPPPPIYQHPS